MMSPVVSVIITVCGRHQFLADAIDSVLAQTFQDFEVIIADDANSSKTAEIVSRYSSDSRIRYRSNQKNLGIALNLRAAAGEARGIFISVLNDDDLWNPHFLSSTTQVLLFHPQISLVFCDHWIIREDGVIDETISEANTRYYHRHQIPEGEVINPINWVLNYNSIPLAMGSVFRADALRLDELVPEVKGAYDFWITCLLCEEGRSFYYLPERLTRYRIHQESESAVINPNKYDCEIYIFNQLMRRPKFRPFVHLIRRGLANNLFQSGKMKVTCGHLKEARKCFIESFRHLPRLKAVIAWILLAPGLGPLRDRYVAFEAAGL